MTIWEWVLIAVIQLVGSLIALKVQYWRGYYDGRHSVVQELADRTFPMATVGLNYPERKVIR